jgi:hypothetical protein
VPAPVFLGSEKLKAIDADAASIPCSSHIQHTFADSTYTLALQTEEQTIDSDRSQLAPVAHMVIASYAYIWLRHAASSGTQPEDVDTYRLPPHEIKKWHLQLRIVQEFWLDRQPQPHTEAARRVAHALVDLEDSERLRAFLTAYLVERQLPHDAVPRLELHRLLFAEYFSCFPQQPGNDRAFDRCIAVMAENGKSTDLEAPPAAVVGFVLLGAYGPSRAADGMAMMQGAIACPFYSQSVRALRERSSSSAPVLGVGDSILLHLWRSYHSPPPQPPPFRTLRCQPLTKAPKWRARVLALPFVRDWHGNPYPEQGASSEASCVQPRSGSPCCNDGAEAKPLATAVPAPPAAALAEEVPISTGSERSKRPGGFATAPSMDAAMMPLLEARETRAAFKQQVLR